MTENPALGCRCAQTGKNLLELALTGWQRYEFAELRVKHNNTHPCYAFAKACNATGSHRGSVDSHAEGKFGNKGHVGR